MAEGCAVGGLEMQQKLGQANEDAMRANDSVEAPRKEKSRAHKELKDKAGAEIEKVCVKELEQGCVISTEDRVEAGQLELDVVQKRNVLSFEALPFAAKETEELKQELSLAITEKNKALRKAEDARTAAEVNAKRITDLSLELNSLKELLKRANVSWMVTEKMSDSNMEVESSEVKELLALPSSIIDPQMLKITKPKDVEAELDERAPMVEKLELELRNAKECESRAVGFLSESKTRISMLVMELEKAKESEAKMLESLISQTKQFEETKISLEEAKLEISSLYESFRSISQGSRDPNVSHQCPKIGKLEETVKMLKKELKLATEAEENSRKAMDGLAFALKEVTTEANQVKEKFASAQFELDDLKKGAEDSKVMVKSTEDKFQVLLGEARREMDSYKQAIERLKREAEESTTSWNAREGGLLDYIKKSEAEIESTKEENRKLVDLLREANGETKMARVEIRNLRDIVKQAVNEATVAKEAAEIARTENSLMKDKLSDMSSALESVTKENERLKIKEDVSLDNFEELLSLNATASTTTLSKTRSLWVRKGADAKHEACEKAKAVAKENKDRKEAIKYTPEQSKKQHFLLLENVQNKNDDASFNSRVLERAELDSVTFSEHDSMSEQKVPTLILRDDGETIKWDDDLEDDTEGGWTNDFESVRSLRTRQRKKKAMLQRFRILLRKKSC